MPHYVALDVSQKTTAICIVDDQGRRLWRGISDTDPGVISARFLEHAGVDVRVVIETGSMTPGSFTACATVDLMSKGWKRPEKTYPATAPALPTRWVHRLALPVLCHE